MRDTLLVIHFIGLAMALGSGFAMTTLGIVAKKLDLEARKAFMVRAFAVSKVGSLGLLLLIVSGILLAMPLWVALKTQGLFHTKLTLVFILALCLGIMQMLQKKAKTGDFAAIAPKLPILGGVMQLLAIAIVTLAVLVFKQPGL